MYVQTPTPTSIFRVEFPRVIYGVAKSYSRRASNVTSSAEVILVPRNHSEKHSPLFYSADYITVNT